METGQLPSLNRTNLCIVEEAPACAERLEIAQNWDLAARPVRILENLNPFRPEERVETLIEPLINESLAAIVTRAGLQPENYDCSLNGQRVPDGDIWRTAVKSGYEVALFPRAGGGKQGSEMLMGLLILVLAFAGGWGAAYGLFSLGLVSPAVGAMIAMGITAVGSSLLSWAFSPGLPSPATYSSTYDPTGPKGLAQPGVPVPKGYGTFGWNGNVISSYVVYANAKAYINALVCYGWGTAVKITSPLINRKNISTFLNCSYQTRLGANTQPAIDGFDRTVNGYPQEIDLLVANGPVVVNGTGTNIQGLEITVKFPSGLYRVTNDGNYVPLKFIYKIEIAPHGTGEWTLPMFPLQQYTQTIATLVGAVETWPQWNVVPTDRFTGSGIVYAYDNGSHSPGDPWSETQTVTTVDPNGNTGSASYTFQGEWQKCDPNLDPVICTHWAQGYCVVENDTTSSFFDTQLIYGLTAGQWDVRVTKIGYEDDTASLVTAGDSTTGQRVCDGWLWNINEVFWSNLSYPNMVLVGVKALATSQMSGSDIQVMSTVTHDIGADTVLPPALAGYEHDNPAIVAYDVIMNPTYGAAATAPGLFVDIPAFSAWAAFNDELVTNQDMTTERRHIFNGVFDQASDVWKTLGTIGTMSRAQVIPLGLMYTVVIDAPGDPVQLFTVGNTKRDSFKEMWVSLDDRCTLLEVDFADAARLYRMDLPVAVMTAADLNSGLAPKIARTRLIGTTSRDQAWRWAYHQLMSTKLSLRAIQFTAPIEAVCCKRGSVIVVQADVTEWAVGGRVQPGSTLTALNIDRTDLTFALASGWTVSVQHPVVQRGTATILSVSGLTITMTAALPAGRILKLVGADGTEYVVKAYSGSAVTLESTTGIASTVPLAAAQVVTLYDVNVIDNLDVTAVTIIPNAGAVLAVAGSFSAVPSADSSWAYGQSAGAQAAKLFRVVSMTRSGDFSFDIGAIEYAASLYTDVIPNYGEIVGLPDTTPAITNLTLTEVYQSSLATNSSNSAMVAVGWQNGRTAAGALVEVNAGTTGTWNILGKIQGQGCTFVGYIGTTYQVRVTGFDWQGNLLGTPVSASITVVASTNAPGNVTNFTGAQNLTSGNCVLAWSAVTGADHYEIRYAPNPLLTAWTTAAVLWDGTALTWTDPVIRTGVYMIVAISSAATGSVESVTPATWQASAGGGLGGGATPITVTVSGPTSFGAGASQSFSAAVTGTTTTTVTWYADGVVQSSSNISFAYAGTHTVMAVSTVSGAFGTLSVNVYG